MKKFFYLLLASTLFLVTACGESTGVAGKQQSKPNKPGVEIIPSASTKSVRFTDTSTTKNVDIGYSGDRDYTFSNFAVTGGFDVTSKDCTINSTGKTLKMRKGGCTLDAKVKDGTTLVNGENSGGTLIFGSNAVALVASGAGAPDLTVREPYRMTSMDGSHYFVLSDITKGEKYTVTLPQGSGLKVLFGRYTDAGKDLSCSMEQQDPNNMMSTFTYTIGANGDLGRNKLTSTDTECSFSIIPDSIATGNTSAAEVVKIEYKGVTTEYLYVYSFFDQILPHYDNNIPGHLLKFEDTVAVGTKSKKVVMMPFPYGIRWTVEFDKGFFTNYTINKEWSTCDMIKTTEGKVQELPTTTNCALVLDFTPSKAGELEAMMYRNAYIPAITLPDGTVNPEEQFVYFYTLRGTGR